MGHDSPQPYPTYKPSGLPWLGEIPAHWEEKRGKYYFREIDERSTTGDEELLSVSHLTGVTPRKESVTMFMAESNAGHKRCQPGDLVINTMWAWMAALGVSRQAGLVSPAYGVYRLCRQDLFQPAYLDYLLRSRSFVAEYMCRSTGIRASRLRLYPEQFLDIRIPRPPLVEQDAMVRYIRHYDQQVNRFIRNRRRLIEVLNEQKQGIISRAVTRGLDPDGPLKPPGVDWLGGIPAHWEIKQLRFLLQGGLSNGLFKKKDMFGRGTPLVNVKDIYQHDYQVHHCDLERVDATSTECGVFEVAPGDLFFVRSSLKLEGTGRCAFIDVVPEPTVFECHLVRGRPDSTQVSSRYLVFLLNSSGIHTSLVSHANTVTMSTLPQGAIASQRVPVPPTREQAEILRAIDRDCAPVLAATTKAQREIDLIHEYRTRLVSDVVTGKVDVRGLASTELLDDKLAERLLDDKALIDEEPEPIEEPEG
jgi:type I restriction enzyme, S subunit